MKHVLFALTAIVSLAGCATIPESTNAEASATENPGTYAVQIIKAGISGPEMEAIYSELFWDPNAPVTKEQMEAVVEDLFSPTAPLTFEEPGNMGRPSLPLSVIASSTIEKIRKMSDAEIYEYPVFDAVPGEWAASDHTESKEMPTDYKVVNGTTVVTTETVKLGHYAEVLINPTEGTNLTCKLKVGFRKLCGTETYTLENGDQAEIPYFNGSEINTLTSFSGERWTMSSGLAEEVATHNSTNKTLHAFFIRMIPKRG